MCVLEGQADDGEGRGRPKDAYQRQTQMYPPAVEEPARPAPRRRRQARVLARVEGLPLRRRQLRSVVLRWWDAPRAGADPSGAFSRQPRAVRRRVEACRLFERDRLRRRSGGGRGCTEDREGRESAVGRSGEEEDQSRGARGSPQSFRRHDYGRRWYRLVMNHGPRAIMPSNEW